MRPPHTAQDAWYNTQRWLAEKETLKRKSSDDSSGDEGAPRARHRKKSAKTAKGDGLPEWTKKKPGEIE